MMIVALVTLRKGEREGFFVLAWGILPLLARAFVDKSYLFFAATVIAFVLVWVMATLLRRYSSWSMVLEVSALLGVCAVLIALVFRENVVLWWSGHISDYMKVIVEAGYLKADEVLSPTQTLWLAQLLLAGFKLALARWWEARLVKTIDFRKELIQTRLDRWALLLFVLLLLAAIGLRSIVFVETLIPLIGCYVVAGLCMLHYWMQGYKYARSALFGFYIVVIIFPYAIALALILGLVDSGLNLKAKPKG
ncbi:MAG: hypothetical protein V4496_07215 [Pseudomonadota bacterium]